MTALSIYETFYAWQGEGAHMGRAAFFIRTMGCPLKCPWCDSAGTWHPNWMPEKVNRVSIAKLVERAENTNAEFVVVTGGEPAIHDLGPLTHELRVKGFPTHVETSGSFPIRGEMTWITLSPKWAKLPLRENVRQAHEFKLIVEDTTSIDRWWDIIGADHAGQPVWLHPEWTKRRDPTVLNSISKTVKQRGKPFRAGYQLHRLFNVDSLDENSRASVPLGGNVALGY